LLAVCKPYLSYVGDIYSQLDIFVATCLVSKLCLLIMGTLK
jgi:hypothetical protein